MRNFKRLMLVVFLALLAAAVLVFVLDNQQLTSMRFLVWTLPSLPLALFLLIALLGGLAVGPLLVLAGRLLGRGGKGR